MSKTPVELWVDALRSGEFAQCRSELRKGDGSLCAGGVACELYRRATGRGEWTDAGFATYDKGIFPFFPPDEVLEWIGDADDYGLVKRATKLNDRGLSFAAIADEIDLLMQAKR